MTGRFILTEVAEEELDQHARYLADTAGEAVARRLYAAAEAAFELLGKQPELAAVRDFGRQELSGLRMWPIRGFEKYLIFYWPIDQNVEIVRVLHASQDIETTLLGKEDSNP